MATSPSIPPLAVSGHTTVPTTWSVSTSNTYIVLSRVLTATPRVFAKALALRQSSAAKSASRLQRARNICISFVQRVLLMDRRGICSARRRKRDKRRYSDMEGGRPSDTASYNGYRVRQRVRIGGFLRRANRLWSHYSRFKRNGGNGSL